MPTIKHVDGTVAEVDDDLAKKLLDDESNIWSSVSKKAPAKKAAESKDSEDK
jgi:hypothetical protein